MKTILIFTFLLGFNSSFANSPQQPQDLLKEAMGKLQAMENSNKCDESALLLAVYDLEQGMNIAREQGTVVPFVNEIRKELLFKKHLSTAIITNMVVPPLELLTGTSPAQMTEENYLLLNYFNGTQFVQKDQVLYFEFDVNSGQKDVKLLSSTGEVQDSGTFIVRFETVDVFVSIQWQGTVSEEFKFSNKPTAAISTEYYLKKGNQTFTNALETCQPLVGVQL